MKKIYFGVFLLFTAFIAKAQFPAPYCAEVFPDGVEPITSVVFNTINNTSAAATGGTAHENFTAISTTVQKSSTYTIQVKGNSDGNYQDFVKVFIDFNNNGIFTDAGESFNVGTITNSTGTDAVVVSTTITIPATAVVGSTRMRVSKKYGAYAAACNAATPGTANYGQAEDYTLNITASTPCSGTPSGGGITPATAIFCNGSSVLLTSTASNIGTGLTYQWQSSAAGVNAFSNIAGATSSTYSANATTNRDYRVVITCSSSGLFANSSVATLTASTPPSNDSVCFAIPLTLNGPANCGNTTCATGYGTITTGAPGNPAFSNSTPNNTVWYTYTPTTTGAAQVRFKRPAGVTTGYLNGWLGIYSVSGSCPYTFTEITSATGAGQIAYDLTTTDSVSVITPSLTAGTTYYFMIDGFSGGFGAYCIQVLPIPSVPLCSTLISPVNGNTTADNLFTLRWSKSANATEYDVYINTTTPPTYYTTVTDTSISLSSNQVGTQFYWAIVPTNIAGDAAGCESNIFNFTTRSAPVNDSCGAAILLVRGMNTNGELTGATTSPATAATCGTNSYTLVNDVWYRINALSNGTATVTVTAPYGSPGFNPVIAVYSGTCTARTLISCSDASTTGTETISLSGLTAGSSYLVRVFANGTITNGGFTITASGPALPVTGVNLTATRNGKNVQLGWQTLTEANNAGFELQRSADGSNFTSFLKVASKANGGNSSVAINYTADDVKPFSGANYYRLKQTDKDGKISYSNVVLIKGLAVSNLVLSAIYPNPTHDVLKAAIQSPVAEKITFVISDMMGKVITRQAASVVNGDNTINLNVTNLPSGNYLLKAICSNGCETAVQKFTKQ